MDASALRKQPDPANVAGTSPGKGTEFQVALVRRAQQDWNYVEVQERLKPVRRLRGLLAENAECLAEQVNYPARQNRAETLAAEIVPLADACRFLELNALSILKPQRLSRRGRPTWLRGVQVELRREPFGVVLVVGAANYPIFLSGVQALQALVAGNGVVIKPALGATPVTQQLVDLFVEAGFDSSLIQVLPEAKESVALAVEARVDKVLLTGSAETGRIVQERLSNALIPSAMELSGCDAVFVLPSADLKQVARCLYFGLRFNGSATCIAPRRVFVSEAMRKPLEQLLIDMAPDPKSLGTCDDQRVFELVQQAVHQGARPVVGDLQDHGGCKSLSTPLILSAVNPSMQITRTDVFAPVISMISVADEREALEVNQQCPYALGATVFGTSEAALAFAGEVDAGCVVLNDMIAPTADPRVPFGGRRQSGFGRTRGAAGLEELTQLKSIVQQKSRWLPHLDDPTPGDAKLLTGFMRLLHGKSFAMKKAGVKNIIAAIVEQQTWKKSKIGGSENESE